MSGFTAGQRYVVREIVPRFLLLTITFKWLLPVTHLFAFHGNLLEAGLYGAAFTALFWFFGGFIAGMPGVQRYLEHNGNRWSVRIMSMALVVGIPAAAVALASLPAPAVFTMTSLWAPLVGTIALNVACALTHDWGAGAANHQGQHPGTR